MAIIETARAAEYRTAGQKVYRLAKARWETSKPGEDLLPTKQAYSYFPVEAVSVDQETNADGEFNGKFKVALKSEVMPKGSRNAGLRAIDLFVFDERGLARSWRNWIGAGAPLDSEGLEVEAETLNQVAVMVESAENSGIGYAERARMALEKEIEEGRWIRGGGAIRRETRRGSVYLVLGTVEGKTMERIVIYDKEKHLKYEILTGNKRNSLGLVEELEFDGLDWTDANAAAGLRKRRNLIAEDILRAKNIIDSAMLSTKEPVTDEEKALILAAADLLSDLNFNPKIQKVVLAMLTKYKEEDRIWNWIMDRVVAENGGKYPAWWEKEMGRFGLFH